MYEDGQGVRRNYVEAARWYNFAANSGDAFAQYYLGAQYLDGRKATPRNYVLAHMWSNLSAANADGISLSYTRADAIKTREIAAKRMKPNQIAEAQVLALAWKPTPKF